jgi:superfamily II DNA/RNA helicase
MAKRLQKEGHSAEAIHGDLKQSKRDRVIASFRKMKYRILVATDVAARGLDIPHIEHVINYDLPQCAEDYVHRIGRTARAGATGSALSFITPADRGKWGAIDRLLNPNSKKESRSRKPSSRKPSRKRPSNAAPRGDVVQLRRDKKKKWSTSKPKKAA